MPFTARLFQLLEAELNRHLSFTLSIEKNLENPGSRRIRLHQRFRCRVSIRNNCSIALTQVRGMISATPFAEFRSAAFALPRLEAHEERELARIDVILLEAPPRGSVFDQIATVNVAAQADLSAFQFSDKGRPLTYAQPTATSRATERPGWAPGPGEGRGRTVGLTGGVRRLIPVPNEG